MFTYDYNKDRGWTNELINKINAHPMISKDKVSFYDQHKYEVLTVYCNENCDLELYNLMKSIMSKFWHEYVTEKLLENIFNGLDKLEFKYKQIMLNKKLDAIEKDF
jgi:hypothetical protein